MIGRFSGTKLPPLDTFLHHHGPAPTVDTVAARKAELAEMTARFAAARTKHTEDARG